MPLGGAGVPRPSMQGEKHPSAILTWALVRSIRSEYTAGNTTHRKLSAKYDISPAAIALILHNKTWRDADYTPPAPRT